MTAPPNGSALSLAFPPELVEAIAERAAEMLADRRAPELEAWIGVEEAAEHLACPSRASTGSARPGASRTERMAPGSSSAEASSTSGSTEEARSDRDARSCRDEEENPVPLSRDLIDLPPLAALAPRGSSAAMRPRPACSRCGGPMGRGRRGGGTCRACVLAAAAARRARIAALAAQGEPPREIAEVFNTTPGVIRVELHRLRRAAGVNTTARAGIVDH